MFITVFISAKKRRYFILHLHYISKLLHLHLETSAQLTSKNLIIILDLRPNYPQKNLRQFQKFAMTKFSQLQKIRTKKTGQYKITSRSRHQFSDLFKLSVAWHVRSDTKTVSIRKNFSYKFSYPHTYLAVKPIKFSIFIPNFIPIHTSLN